MALIKCEDCGKEISDKAPACPNCGAPQAGTVTQTITEPSVIEQKKEVVVEKKMLCPKCYSDKLTSDKKGFQAGKAIVGGLLVGPLGLAGGLLGSKKLVIYCIACGHKFKPGEHATKKPKPPTKAEENASLIQFTVGFTVVAVFIALFFILAYSEIFDSPTPVAWVSGIVAIGCGVLVWLKIRKKWKITQ